MNFFTPEQIAILSAGTVRVDLLVEFHFVSGVKRVWNGNTRLITDTRLWEPMYGIGSIDGLSATSGTAAKTVTFQISGIPGDQSGLLAQALEETPEVSQQPVHVYLQLFDDDWQPIGSPIGIWWGFMQPLRVSRSEMGEAEGAVQSITVTAENVFFGRSRPPYGRYTDRDQQVRSPGDRFLAMTPSLLFKSFDYPVY